MIGSLYQGALVKFYWKTATFVCLYILYGYCHTTMPELNSCDRSVKPKIFTTWPEKFADSCVYLYF